MGGSREYYEGGAPEHIAGYACHCKLYTVHMPQNIEHKVYLRCSVTMGCLLARYETAKMFQFNVLTIVSSVPSEKILGMDKGITDLVSNLANKYNND